MPAGKGVKVVFNTRVSWGFKPDTKGFEATLDADGKPVCHSITFEPGDEFDVPEPERDVAEALIDSGACREA